MNKRNTQTQKRTIRHIWSVLCQRTIIDKMSNKLTLFDILEQVTIDRSQFEEVSKKNTIIPVSAHVALVTMWYKSDNLGKKAKARIRIISPQGKILKEEIPELKFKKDKKRLRFIAHMRELPISKAGEYTFTTEIKEDGMKRFEKCAKVPLDVKIANFNQSS